MTLKWCYACKTDKDRERDFSINRARSDDRNNMCKACKKVYNAGHYGQTKAKFNPGRAERRKRAGVVAREHVYDYLRTHPCVDCGETDIVVLDFDHQFDKVKDISVLLQDGASWSTILKEIEKCEVVCANDHRRRTARTFGWRRALPV